MNLQVRTDIIKDGGNMNITTNDILDSLMRVALQPNVTRTVDSAGNPMAFQEPSLMEPIVRQISQSISNDADLKAAIVAQVIGLVPSMVPAIQQRLVTYVVEERTERSSWGGGSYTKAVIAKWAEEPIQQALVEALRTKIEEHVVTTMGDLPLERYDVNITVNLVPKT